jgi:hypothetical protein
MNTTVPPPVLSCNTLGLAVLRWLLSHYDLALMQVPADRPIPGSYWGESEAGLMDRLLWVRADTPAHSALHEACHYVCMDADRRAGLDTDAGGDYEEENGVCYLQILLAGALPCFGRARMMRDMDAWGYSFRLGSARAWFEGDAEDARCWLLQAGLIDSESRVTWRLRAEANRIGR